MFIEMNEIPDLIGDGKISKKEAVNYFAEFIYKNPAIFGLEKESADFRNDLIVQILEKGEKIIDSYNPKLAGFFSFFYATIKGRIKALRKKECRSNINQSCIYEELLQDLSYEGIKYIGYKEIRPVNKGYKKPPYAVPRVKPEDIEGFFKQQNLSKEIRTVFIILFKYAFYIDYQQLKNICWQTGIDYDFLIKIKDYCMDYLDKKVQAQEKAAESRNRTYFMRKKTSLQIKSLEKELTGSPCSSPLEYKLDSLQSKYKRQTERLKRDNSEIIKKSSHIVLQDRQIANFLGLCERQVRYYISRAKNNKINFSDLGTVRKSENE